VGDFLGPLLEKRAKPYLGFIVRNHYGEHQANQQQAGFRICAGYAWHRLDDGEIGLRRIGALCTAI
jgi:hypothetical protein